MSAEESCAATAFAVARRAFSTSPTPSADEPAADADAAAVPPPSDKPAYLENLKPVEGENVLRVSRSTTPRMLATKIGAVLDELPDREVVVSAVGPQALFSAARALALVNEDRAGDGKGPAVVMRILDVGARNAKAFVVALPDPSLGITHGSAALVDEERRFALRKAHDSPIAPLASALKHAALDTDRCVQVSAIGAVATSHMVFATFLATSWAKEDGADVVFVPGRQLVEGGAEGGMTLAILKFFLVRTSPKPDAPVPAG